MSSSRPPSKLGSFGALVVVSLLCGVLVAGLLAPIVGGIGLSGRAVADTIRLPVQFELAPLAQRTRILAADGSLIADFYDQNRREITLDQVPDVTIQALLAVEDSRFYEHNGVDPQGVMRSLVKNSASGSVQGGGSTITQQYVKNVRINLARTDEARAAATANTLERKLDEARMALAVEERFSKSEILERYLNIAYFGAGAYGVGMAAQRYFSKPVSKLTLAESALIMGLVKNPVGYDPTRRPARALDRRNLVLQRMFEVGSIDAVTLAETKAQPLNLQPRETPNGCTRSPYPGFCHYIEEAILNDEQFGATREERLNHLRSAGVTIKTTLDPKVQQAAQKAVDQTIAPRVFGSDKKRVATALAMVEPGTGNVLALAQNVPYGDGKDETTVLYSTGTGSKRGDGTQNPGFQTGSTFKMFTLIAAIEAGMPLTTTISSPGHYTPDPAVCKAPGSGYFRNSDEGHGGTVNMWTGTAQSTNTFFVQLQERLGGINPVVDVAKRMGYSFRGDNSSAVASPKNCAVGLGTTSHWPLDVANAYATIAAHGKYCKPRVIQSLKYVGEDAKAAEPPACRQALKTDVADTVAAVLRGPIERGTATREGQLGRPAAGKTGTTNNVAEAWFAGFVPQVSTAVWVGRPNGQGRVPQSLGGFRTLDPDVGWGPGYGASVYGGSIPTIIWRRAMLGALDGVPVIELPAASPSVVHGEAVTVPSVAGLSRDAALEAMSANGLRGVISGTPVASTLPKNTATGSSPGAGARVPVGSTVTILVSSGVPPVVEPTPTPTATDPGVPLPLPSETPTGPVVPPTDPATVPPVTDAPVQPDPGINERGNGNGNGRKR